MSSTAAALSVLVCLALAACRPPAVETATAAPPPAPAVKLDEDQSICLAETSGSPVVDGDIRKSLELARKLPLKPDSWVAAGRGWVRKARYTSDPGFYVNVAACVAAALAVEPDYLPALELRGLALMNEHRFAEAAELARSLLARDPASVIALGLASDALLELGRFEEAAAAAQQLMDVKPGMAAYSRSSYFRWLQGDRANAKRLIRDALKAGRDARDPEPAAWTFVEAARIYASEGDYDGADAVYAEALKWVPDYPAALVGRARVALARDDPRRALAWLETAYRVNPLAETAWLLGDARSALGDAEGARAAYDRVIETGRRIDRLTLATFYATRDRDREEAVRLLEEEREVRGGVYVDDAYAWALYRAGRLREARAASDSSLRLGTDDARLYYHAGAIRLAQGDASGRKLVARALALNPGFDWTGAAEARALLGREKTATVAGAAPGPAGS